jgi:hypothetical protein
MEPAVRRKAAPTLVMTISSVADADAAASGHTHLRIRVRSAAEQEEVGAEQEEEEEEEAVAVGAEVTVRFARDAALCVRVEEEPLQVRSG